MRMLFLDDDSLRRRFIAKAAKNLDVEFVCVSGINEFEKAVEKGSGFDIVSLDYELLDGSGLDAVDALIDSGYTTEALIVVHSHSRESEKMIKVLETTRFGVLKYPFGTFGYGWLSTVLEQRPVILANRKENIKKLVFVCLDNAIENGYDQSKEPALRTAIDLAYFSPELETVSPEVIEPFVKEFWEHKNGKV